MGDGFGICMSFYHPWIAIVSVSGILELVVCRWQAPVLFCSGVIPGF